MSGSLFGGARNIINGGSSAGSGGSWGGSWLHENIWGNKTLRATVSWAMKTGMSWSQWAYANARTIGWFVVTTAMITAVPLIFEYNREFQLEELEQLQIAKGLAEGGTPLGLAQQGLASAVEPKVLR